MSVSISPKEMFENGVHYGHKASRWNPKMKKYIFTKSSGIHIFDLEKTASSFQQALEYMYEILSENKNILFVSTKDQTSPILEEYAKAVEANYVTYRWLGGTLTNFKTIKSRIKHYKHLRDILSDEDNEDLKKHTKKEILLMQRELHDLEKSFAGIETMTKLPDALFITDANHDAIAILEAKKLGIPVIGFVDTNADPDKVDYAIPCNDDAPESLRYMLGKINELIAYTKMNPKKKEEKKKSPKTPPKAVPKVSEEIKQIKDEGVKKTKAKPKAAAKK